MANTEYVLHCSVQHNYTIDTVYCLCSAFLALPTQNLTYILTSYIKCMAYLYMSWLGGCPHNCAEKGLNTVQGKTAVWQFPNPNSVSMFIFCKIAMELCVACRDTFLIAIWVALYAFWKTLAYVYTGHHLVNIIYLSMDVNSTSTMCVHFRIYSSSGTWLDVNEWRGVCCVVCNPIMYLGVSKTCHKEHERYPYACICFIHTMQLVYVHMPLYASHTTFFAI